MLRKYLDWLADRLWGSRSVSHRRTGTHFAVVSMSDGQWWLDKYNEDGWTQAAIGPFDRRSDAISTAAELNSRMGLDDHG